MPKIKSTEDSEVKVTKKLDIKTDNLAKKKVDIKTSKDVVEESHSISKKNDIEAIVKEKKIVDLELQSALTTKKTKLSSKVRNGNEKLKYATGKRKRSIAKVWIYESSESRPSGIVINDKSPEVFFSGNVQYINKILKPFVVCNLNIADYCVVVSVSGGGLTGCADAIMLGIARCLATQDDNCNRALRHEKLLTRDDRIVEPKKYGLRKARKKEQYSKR